MEKKMSEELARRAKALTSFSETTMENLIFNLVAENEEIPHAQGKRNPSKTVGVVRGHQRADTLKP